MQGVFFRSSAKKVAESLGLVGWVRNNDDGSVEALAKGSKENLEKFVSWCKKGPLAATVERVEVNWSKATGEFDKFVII